MKITVLAVGRMKSGPEKELAGRYLDRFAKVAPTVGLSFGGLTELAEGRGRAADERRREEGAQLAPLAADRALVLLDEGGRNLSSEELASLVGRWRDGGRREVVFAIGGPDGHDPAFAAAAEVKLAFGAATWPHQIVRVMLAEQLYRVATILSGHPYHRGSATRS